MPEEIAAEAAREPADAPTRPADGSAAEPETHLLAPDTEPDAPHPMSKLVDQWFDEHFRGSHIARDTHAWNILFAALPDLKRRLIEGT